MAGTFDEIIRAILAAMGQDSGGIAVNDPRTDRTTPYTGPQETPDVPIPTPRPVQPDDPGAYWDRGIPGVLSAPPRWTK
jgi:hypothetical protein